MLLGIEHALVLSGIGWPLSISLRFCCCCCCLLHSLSNIVLCCSKFLICLPSLVLYVNSLHSVKMSWLLPRSDTRHSMHFSLVSELSSVYDSFSKQFPAMLLALNVITMI